MKDRFEFISKKNEVQYISDASAINLNAAWFALEYFPANIIWIVSGFPKCAAKQNEIIASVAREKVKGVICLNPHSKIIHKMLYGSVDFIITEPKIENAVIIAKRLSQKGDIVLLAPGIKSIHLYPSIQKLIEKYKEAVRQI